MESQESPEWMDCLDLRETQESVVLSVSPDLKDPLDFKDPQDLPEK